MSGTALERAVQGQKVEGKAAESGLKEAAKKLVSLKDRLETAKENAAETGTKALHAAETIVTTFGASTAEGLWGRDKLRPGGVPIRAAAGMVLGGWGFYESLACKGGVHQIAIATGLVASEAASLGVEAGRALREKWDKTASSTGTPAGAGVPQIPPVPQALLAQNPQWDPAANQWRAGGHVYSRKGAQISGQDDLGALSRTIRMSPGTEGERRGDRRGRDGWMRARAA